MINDDTIIHITIDDTNGVTYWSESVEKIMEKYEDLIASGVEVGGVGQVTGAAFAHWDETGVNYSEAV